MSSPPKVQSQEEEEEEEVQSPAAPTALGSQRSFTPVQEWDCLGTLPEGALGSSSGSPQPWLV